MTVQPTASSILHLAKKNQWNNVLQILDSLEGQIARYDAGSSDAAAAKVAGAIICQLSTEYDVRSGNTVGHFAAAANRVDVLELLFRLGVDLRKSNFSNRSPMQEARNKEKDGALEYILDNVYVRRV